MIGDSPLGPLGQDEQDSRLDPWPVTRLSEDGAKRLEVMAQSSDGFVIAEADLQIRGPGDFLGTRQADFPS